MKKYTSLLIFFSVFSSCTALKQLSHQEIIGKTGCSTFDFNKKAILMNVKVDNQNQVFLLDTGATLSVISDSTAVENYYKKEKGSFGSIKGADSKKADLVTITSRLDSELFFCENKIFASLNMPTSQCDQKKVYKGIIGLDVFFTNDNPLLVDFSNAKLCNITLDKKKSLLTTGYSRIKSECDSGKVFVFFTIDGKEYRFKLDTGFSGNIIIPNDDRLDFQKYKSITYEGTMLKTATSFTNGEETYYEDVSISSDALNVRTKIQVSKSIKAQNIGVNFMKGFDWIIDFKNNEVYMKRNNLEIDNFFNATIMEYFSFVKEGKLIVSTKLKTAGKYNVGDEIISVNNQEVTSENICEMQNLLNKTSDWQTLKVDIVSSNKI